MTVRKAARLAAIAVFCLVSMAPKVFAQGEDFDIGWESGGASFAAMSGATKPGVTMSGGFAYNWNTPYGDEPLSCRMWVRSRPNDTIIVGVTILTADGEYQAQSIGNGYASAVARMPSIFNNSPGEYVCHGSYTTLSGGAGYGEINARSAIYRGRYSKLFWNYDIIDYYPSNCDIPGMFLGRVTMSQPAPGWPDVSNPPEFMADEGARFTAGGWAAPLYINFFGPRGLTPPCIAAQCRCAPALEGIQQYALATSKMGLYWGHTSASFKRIVSSHDVVRESGIVRYFRSRRIDRRQSSCACAHKGYGWSSGDDYGCR